MALTTQEVVSFVKDNGFTAISKVRISEENSYPIVTFIKTIDGKTEAENVFFSKGAATLVSLDMTPKEAIIDNDLKICYTTNADGEDRIKLGRANGGDYTDVETLFA